MPAASSPAARSPLPLPTWKWVVAVWAETDHPPAPGATGSHRFPLWLPAEHPGGRGQMEKWQKQLTLVLTRVHLAREM